MHVRLTLRDAAGNALVAKEARIRTLASLAGDTGQAAWALLGEAHRAGHDILGTTMSIEEFEPDTAAVVAKARAIQRRKP